MTIEFELVLKTEEMESLEDASETGVDGGDVVVD